MPTDSKSKRKSDEEECNIEIIMHEEPQNEKNITANGALKSCIISDVNLLQDFIKLTLELREIVKCALCLDVMNHPVEISCSHNFCEGCLNTFLEQHSDKPKCPICRNVISKRSRKLNESLLGYIDFVNDVNRELKTSFDCEVMDLGNNAKFKEKFDTKRTQRKRANSTSSVSDIIPGTIQDKTVKKRKSGPAKKTASKQIQQKLRTTARIKSFKNNENRDSVIHWLNDNKNRFDRITQTQRSVSSRYSQESLDMPSVSQLKQVKGEIRAKLTNLRRRAMSIDVEREIIQCEPRIRCNSWPCESANNLEDYLADEEYAFLLLEEIKTTAALKQKEEEFLDSIETELKMQANNKLMVEDEKLKKLKPVVLLENTNHDESVEAYFKANISKITNEGVDFCEGSQEFKRPGKRAKRTSSEKKISETACTSVTKCSTSDEHIFQIPTQKVMLLSVENSKELVNKLDNCLERIESESCSDSNVYKNCRNVREYVTKILKILNNIHDDVDEFDLNLPSLPDICLSQKHNSIATQTEIICTNAETQTHEESNESSQPFNGSIISKLLAKYGKANNNYGEMPSENASPALSSDRFNKSSFKNKSGTVAQISNSFDNIDFDTQQLIEKHKRNSDSNSDKKQINRRLDYSETGKKKFKRIRTPSNSDSDSELQEKKRNKYLQEDLSVNFESEVPPKNSQEDFKFSDDINEVVDKILGKYNGENSTKINRRTDDVIERCERIIKEVEKKQIKPIAPVSLSPGTVDEFNNFSGMNKNAFSSEETFNDCTVLEAIDRDIEESKKKLTTKQNTLSESLFKYSYNEKQNKELDDSFTEEIALLEPQNDEKNKIKVLQNITIMQQKATDSDDEIFSDIDIVENTPPKKRQSSVLESNSQINQYFLQDPLSNFDVILPPPPEFQEDDTTKRNTEQDIIEKTLTEHMKAGSITPDFLSPPQLLSQRINAMGTSTPISGRIHSQKSLNISPIGFERNKNPFEAAKNVKNSPLTVITNTPPVLDQKATAVSKQQQSILSYIKKPIVTCSRLAKDQMAAVSSLTNKKLAIFTGTFGPNVTHVVVSVNEKNCVRDHTIKYVCGVAAGIWVVNFKWVQECLAQNRIVPEELYEVKDVSGIDGPRQSRLVRTKKPLFKGFKVFAAPPFLSTTQADVESVVKMLGGKVVSNPDALLSKQGHICLIIAEASATQDFEIYESWLETLKIVTVDIEWLSRSVGQYKILSFRPFALCSEDLLDNLGYPEEMVASMHFSNSQSTYSAPLT